MPLFTEDVKKLIILVGIPPRRGFLPPKIMNGALDDDSDYGVVKADPQWWMSIPPFPVDNSIKR